MRIDFDFFLRFAPRSRKGLGTVENSSFTLFHRIFLEFSVVALVGSVLLQIWPIRSCIEKMKIRCIY